MPDYSKPMNIRFGPDGNPITDQSLDGSLPIGDQIRGGIKSSGALRGLQAASPMGGPSGGADQQVESLMARNQGLSGQTAKLFPASQDAPQAAPTPDQMPQGGGMLQQALRALGMMAPPPAPRTSDINLPPDPTNQLPLDELMRRAQAIR